MYEDTIAAISTALGSSGIAIIRISGERAIFVADQVFLSPGGRKKLYEQPSHTIHYGHIVDEAGVIDEVMVSILRGPRSFTAEDTVEINCHGGVYAARRVLDVVLRNGARPAEPGEFTKRAFLNGRIDLAQAESVIDVIHAKNEFALKSSVGQLGGSLSRSIRGLREKLLYQTAFIESALDDPEHYTLEGYNERLKEELREVSSKLSGLIASADNGRMLKEGISTVILGKPNAGKSSLLNALLGVERAIVTEVAGTTRDVLEESLSLNGITLTLTDTAGIRNTSDVVEKIGVERAKEAALRADLVLYVVDAGRPLDENDREILQFIRDKKCIVLLNKSDLETCVTKDDLKVDFPILSISAKEETGIEELTDCIKELFYLGEISFNDEVYITSARQKAALVRAKESLSKVRQSMELGLPEDFFTIDLMDAYGALGEILGEEVGEDLVDEIFGRFCMGK